MGDNLQTAFGLSTLIGNTAPKAVVFKRHCERLATRVRAIMAPLAVIRRRGSPLAPTTAAVDGLVKVLTEYYRYIGDMTDGEASKRILDKGPRNFPNRFPELAAQLRQSAVAVAAAVTEENAADPDVPLLENVDALFDPAQEEADSAEDLPAFESSHVAYLQQVQLEAERRQLADEAAKSAQERIKAAVNAVAPQLTAKCVAEPASQRRAGASGKGAWGIPAVPPSFPRAADGQPETLAVACEAAISTVMTRLTPSAAGAKANRVAVVGNRGVGKFTATCQAATKAAERFATGGWYLDGSTPGAVSLGLQRIAHDLGLGRDLHADELATAVRIELGRPQRAGWIILVTHVDQADDIASLIAQLPTSGGCIVVTSTLSSDTWDAQSWATVSVAPWSAADAAEYLADRHPAGSDGAAAVAEAVAGMPFALAIAKAHAAQQSLSWDAYSVKLADARSLLEAGPDREKIAPAYAAVRAIVDEYEQGKLLLQLLQLGYPSQIPRAYFELVHRRIFTGGSILAVSTLGDTGFDRTLDLLAKYGLASVSPVTVAFHPLLLPALALGAGEPKQAAAGNMAEVTGGLANINLQGDVELARLMALQLKAAQAVLDRTATDSEELGTVLGALGLFELTVEGRAAAAVPLLERSLMLLAPAEARGLSTVSRHYVTRGRAYTSVGEAGKALADLKRAEALLSRAVEAVSAEDTEDAQLALADAHGAAGDHAAHKALAEKALAAREKRVGDEHPSLAPLLISLAAANGALGDVRRQKELLERAMPLQERAYGSDHGIPSNTLAALGLVYGAMADANQRKIELIKDRPSAAQQLSTLSNLSVVYSQKRLSTIERALATRQKRLGSDHPSATPWMMQLAEAYTASEQRNKRIELLRRVLQLQELHHGTQSTELVRVLTLLGTTLAADPPTIQEAASVLERALRLQEGAPGPKERSLISILTELEKLYRTTKAEANQRATLERLRSLHEQQADQDSLGLAYVLFTLGTMWMNDGKLDDSKSALQRAAALQDTPANRETVDPTQAYINLGTVAYRANDVGTTVTALERARELQEQHFGPKHMSLVPTLINLSAAYIDKKLYTKARPLMERALEIEKERYGADHPNVVQLQGSLNNVPPHLHPLAKTSMLTSKCNLCSKTYTTMQSVYRCSACNYDECAECFKNSGSKEKNLVSVAQPAAPVAKAAAPAAAAGAGAAETSATPVESLEVQDGQPKKKGGCCVVQ